MVRQFNTYTLISNVSRYTHTFTIFRNISIILR